MVQFWRAFVQKFFNKSCKVQNNIKTLVKIYTGSL